MSKKLTSQQESAIDFSKHISLTANAGSGKTFVLKKRYVEIALQEGINLNNIVAITFTEKAASKLYKDITQEIEDRLSYETNSKAVYKLEALRRDLVSANISTIHSFCTNILKEFSPEAEIDANFIPIDTVVTKELINQSLEELFKNLGRGNEIDLNLKNLIRFFSTKKQVIWQLFEMIYKRDKVLTLDKELYSKTDENITEVFRIKFDEMFNTLIKDDTDNILKQIKLLNNIVLTGAKNKNNALEISGLINECYSLLSSIDYYNKLILITEKLFTKDGKVRSVGYLTKELRTGQDQLITEIESFVFFKVFPKVISGNENNLILAKLGKQLVFVFKEALRIFDKKKEINGFLDFDDLLLKTLEILKNEDVVFTLSERFKYIMIDEYQDTNEVQYNIFMPMLKYLQQNNLFVVGDEKQSIYMFRDAELEIFNRTKNNINQIDKSSNLKLTHSFRVAPVIALFTNKLFKNLFSSANISFNEVEYCDLICARDDIKKGSIEFLLASEEEEEAKLIAKKINQVISLSEDNNYSGFAVLCRERSHFKDLEKVFGEYKIPFVVLGGTGFYQRQMVQDIYNFLSFIYNTKNDLALLGLLRSPFYTVSDSTITLISLEEEEFLFDKLCKYSQKDKKITYVLNHINKCIKIYENSDITEVLHMFLVDTGYWGIIASKIDRKQELANLEKLINIIIAAYERSFFNIYDFIGEIGTFIEEMDKESQAQVGNNENAVKIMTLHKAKGLEFNTVFLFKLHTKFKIPKIKSKEITIDKTLGILTKVPPMNDYFSEYVNTPLNDIYNYISYKKQLAEDKRLLYVGVTRAIDNLILTAAVKDIEKIDNTFLGFIANGLHINFNAERYTISGELEFLINGTEYYKKSLEYNIDIVKSIEENEQVSNQPVLKKSNFDDYYFNTDIIKDNPKNEIFTASKFISYNFCPVMYKLYYEYAYHKLLDLFNNDFIFEETKEEEVLDIKNESLIVGIICHKVLSEDASFANLHNNIQNKIETYFLTDEETKAISTKIETLLSGYLKSDTFKELDSYNTFFNEYELYKYHNDFYLYGIIDRLIIEDDKIIVVDYKTNRREANSFDSKVEYYLPQLKFYGYLVNKYFVGTKQIYLKLVFLEEPDKNYTYLFDSNEGESIGKDIVSAIENIRKNNYIAYTQNCKKCIFNKNCEDSVIIKGNYEKNNN
ncbi:MAG: UvrD-helicase domain-containing protein [bacterium]